MTATRTPGDVTRYGVRIRKDGPSKWTVERDGCKGVIFNEARMNRGRWAAWSPFADTPHHIAAFTDDPEKAVDAILATLPVRVSTLAAEAGVPCEDVLSEAARLCARWSGIGRSAVFCTRVQGGSTEIAGGAALVIREALAARTAKEPAAGEPE